MQTSIVKWGNSQGVRIPKILLDSVNLSSNDIVEVVTENNNIVIKKINNKRIPKSIQERFALYPEDFVRDDELDWGDDIGEEILCD